MADNSMANGAPPVNGSGNGVAAQAGPGVNPLAGPGTDFKPVALGAGANLEALPAYFTDPLLGTGNLPGLAISSFNNRALRQGTFVASSLCQWISNQSNIYIPDDGSQINWITEFQNALAAFVAALIPAGPNLGAYLPLAGGTMVGNISFQPGISTVLANSTWYFAKDTGGTARGLILKGSDNNVYINDGTAPYVMLSGTPAINNNVYYSGRDSGGAVRALVGMLSDNCVHIGGSVTVFADVGPGSSLWSSGNVVTGNNAWFYCRDSGGTPRAVLGFSPSGNALQIGVGSITETHVYGGTGWVYIHSNLNPLGQLWVNGYSYLNGGGRAYIAGGNDPFQIYADYGFYARHHYIVASTRDWSCGVLPSGIFAIADESAAAVRFEIGLDGTAYFFGPLNPQSTLTVSGQAIIYGGEVVYNNLNVASGSVWIAGNIQQVASIAMSGQLFIGGQPSIYDLGNGWLYFGGNFRIGYQLEVDGNLTCLSNIYTPANIGCSGNMTASGAVITNYIQDNGSLSVGGSTYTSYLTVGGNASVSGALSVANYAYISGPSADLQLIDGTVYHWGKVSYTPRSMCTRLGQGLEGFYMNGGWFCTFAYGPAGGGGYDCIFTAPGIFQVANSGEGYKASGGMWIGYSERRLKKNIEDYEPGLEVIRKLKPRRFQFNGVAPSIDDGRVHVGLVADEVEELMPELIHVPEGAVEGFKGLDATPVVYALINAVRELAAKVEMLEGRA
jgi:hypothetical protein